MTERRRLLTTASGMMGAIARTPRGPRYEVGSAEAEEPAEALGHLVHEIPGHGADEFFEVGLAQRGDLRSVGDGVASRPVRRLGSSVLPGARARAVLLVSRHTTTVLMRLAFTSSRWRTRTGWR